MRILPTNAGAVLKIPRRTLHATTSTLLDVSSKPDNLKCDIPEGNENKAHRRIELHHHRPRYFGSNWNGGQDRFPSCILNRRFISGAGSSTPVFTTKKGSSDQQEQETHRIMTATKQELDELLTSASKRAREIYALAVTKTNRTSTETKTADKDNSSPSAVKEAQNAIEAADALLALTSHSNFKMALDEKRENETVEKSREKTLYLHSAFITVISWLCSVLNSLPSPPSNEEDNKKITHTNFEMGASEQDFILAHILDLMSRSTDLKLPLHLPLYRRIATLLAEYNTTSDTALLILDLSTQARLSLSVSHESPSSNSVLTSEFFSDPLKILARHNQSQQIIDVIEGMNSLHQLQKIDYDTAYELLKIFSQRLTEMRKHLKNNPSLILKENYQSEIFNLTQLSNTLEAHLTEQIGEDSLDIMNDFNSLELDSDELDEVDETSYSNEIVTEDDHMDNTTGVEDTNSFPIESDNISTNSQKLSTLSLDEKVEKILKGEGDDELVENVKKEADSIIKFMRKKRNNEKPKSIDEKLSNPSEDLNGVDAVVTARVHVDPVTGNVENVELAYNPKLPTTPAVMSNDNKPQRNFSPKAHQSMAKEIIYLRNPNAWDLPDITQQLQSWNNDNDILFTKEYETELINEYLSYEQDEDLLETGAWNYLDYLDDDDDGGFS